jgi:enoyl-CoA hydratase/carnithine racemase
MRFSTPDCRLSIMESRWGLIPDMGASITLREILRMDVAKELTMTGRIISGNEAERIGLVTRCVDDPMEEAMKVVNEIIERYVSHSHRSAFSLYSRNNYGSV